MNKIKFAVIGDCHYSKTRNYSTRACIGAKLLGMPTHKRFPHFGIMMELLDKYTNMCAYTSLPLKSYIFICTLSSSGAQ